MYMWLWIAAVGSIVSFGLFMWLLFKYATLLKKGKSDKKMMFITMVPFLMGVLLAISSAYCYFYIAAQMT